MNFKTLATAALLAVAPLAANAFSVTAASNLANGGTYDIANGPYFWDATFTGNDGAGSVSFSFTNTTGSDAHIQIADGTVGQSNVGSFAGVTASWANGGSTTIAQSNTSVGGGFSISSFIADGASDVLTLSWGNVSGFKSNIDFTVAAVPLPAGFLMLGTALFGAGALASRRKS